MLFVLSVPLPSPSLILKATIKQFLVRREKKNSRKNNNNNDFTKHKLNTNYPLCINIL